MSVLVQELVNAGVYPDINTAIQEAVRVLWQERHNIRIEVAIYRYRTEELSIAMAASVARVSFDRMKALLAERGVPLRLGPATITEALAEVEALQKMRL